MTNNTSALGSQHFESLKKLTSMVMNFGVRAIYNHCLDTINGDALKKLFCVQDVFQGIRK